MARASLATEYRVSTRWIKLQKQRDTAGDIAPRRRKGGHKPNLADHTERLLELAKEQPDASLREFRDRLCVPVSIGTTW